MADNTPKIDSELDNLLDSALDEFDVLKKKGKENAAQSAETAAGEAAADQSENEGAFGIDPNQMRETLNMLMKENPIPGGQNAEDDPESARAMQETLGLFAKSLDRLQEQSGEFNTEDLLSDVFKGLSFDGAESLGNLLSDGLDDVLTKSLLYPGLKDIHDKLPKWLEDNRDKASEVEIKRVESQNDFVKEIIGEYESEKDDDSKEVKAERQRRILESLGKMQELGDLPAELLEKPAGLEFPGLGEGADAIPPGSWMCTTVTPATHDRDVCNSFL